MAPYPNHSITKPEIKIGLRLDDNYADTLLLPRIKDLLRTTSCFPGTQPINFKKCHFDLLESEEYFVRDKTDGKRYIMFFTSVAGGTAFMMDELNQSRILTGFKLPLHNNLNQFHNETMMDGEVVMEIDNEKTCLRYLIFDLMVLNGSVLIDRPYNKRLGMLRQEVIEPLNALLQKNLEIKNKMPFTIEIKTLDLSYGFGSTLQKISTLKYGNEGLIFVPVNHPYVPGISEKLLLWRPAKQINADFKIKTIIQNQRDKKPVFHIMISDKNQYKKFDQLTLEPSMEKDWHENLPDEKIGRFWYDKNWETKIQEQGYAPQIRIGGWRFIKFCPDKQTADTEQSLQETLQAIENAVPREMLEERSSVIRNNWKLRQTSKTINESRNPSSSSESSSSTFPPTSIPQNVPSLIKPMELAQQAQDSKSNFTVDQQHNRLEKCVDQKNHENFTLSIFSSSSEKLTMNENLQGFIIDLTSKENSFKDNSDFPRKPTKDIKIESKNKIIVEKDSLLVNNNNIDVNIDDNVNKISFDNRSIANVTEKVKDGNEDKKENIKNKDNVSEALIKIESDEKIDDFIKDDEKTHSGSLLSVYPSSSSSSPSSLPSLINPPSSHPSIIAKTSSVANMNNTKSFEKNLINNDICDSEEIENSNPIDSLKGLFDFSKDFDGKVVRSSSNEDYDSVDELIKEKKRSSRSKENNETFSNSEISGESSQESQDPWDLQATSTPQQDSDDDDHAYHDELESSEKEDESWEEFNESNIDIDNHSIKNTKSTTNQQKQPSQQENPSVLKLISNFPVAFNTPLKPLNLNIQQQKILSSDNSNFSQESNCNSPPKFQSLNITQSIANKESNGSQSLPQSTHDTKPPSTMTITAKNNGFGELFPSSNKDISSHEHNSDLSEFQETQTNLKNIQDINLTSKLIIETPNQTFGRKRSLSINTIPNSSYQEGSFSSQSTPYDLHKISATYGHESIRKVSQSEEGLQPATQKQIRDKLQSHSQYIPLVSGLNNTQIHQNSPQARHKDKSLSENKQWESNSRQDCFSTVPTIIQQTQLPVFSNSRSTLRRHTLPSSINTQIHADPSMSQRPEILSPIQQINIRQSENQRQLSLSSPQLIQANQRQKSYPQTDSSRLVYSLSSQPSAPTQRFLLPDTSKEPCFPVQFHQSSSTIYHFNNLSSPQQQETSQVVKASLPQLTSSQRPLPQKRKSKGALDFILNEGTESTNDDYGSSQKRGKFDYFGDK